MSIPELINKYAVKYELKPEVVACVVLKESKGDTFAWRWEEKFWKDNLEDKRREELSGFVPPGLPSLYDEKQQRSSSYGLMQVLGETARWCAKFKGPYLTALCDPEIGMDVGCKVLRFYLDRAKGDYSKALKYYNGSQSYANEVLDMVARKEYLKLFR